MPTTAISPGFFSSRDALIFRTSVLIGGMLIALFMMGDLQLVPKELTDAYFTNRAFVQAPILLALFVSSFHPRFFKFAKTASFLTILSLIYTNYYFIYASWQLARYSFPYEGTLLYAFFGFFVFGMTFRSAILLMVLSSLGFICLVLMVPVYGDRAPMSVGFVAASLFIGALGRYRQDKMLTALKSANKQLITLSTTDSLTGLLNRRALVTESERLFTFMDRSDQLLAVFMIDLDHFKKFNDHYGHQQGDRAIRFQADILSSVFKRETDIIGRYGGEEFVVVAVDGSVSGIEQKAESILAKWQDAAIQHEGSPGGGLLSCSIGICHGMAVDFDSLEDMIQAADQAMYRAKESGRGTFVVA